MAILFNDILKTASVQNHDTYSPEETQSNNIEKAENTQGQNSDIPEEGQNYRIIKTDEERYALYIGLNVTGAEHLAMDGGEDPKDFHVTLAYGYFKAQSDDDETSAKLQSVRAKVVKYLPETLKLDKIGRFEASESSDGKDVIYARVAPGQLEKVHNILLKELKHNGLSIQDTFDEYHPHMTLKYIDPDEEVELKDIDETVTIKSLTEGFETKESSSKENKSTFKIAKTDEDKRLIFGWASVAIRADGEQIVDHQKDLIDPEDLEEAVYEYVLNFRDGGEEHIETLRMKAKMVESCVFTKEKQQAMGIPEGIVPEGWWIGFYVSDDEAWAKVKDGTYQMFSIEGAGVRVEVDDEVKKYNHNHGPDGRFTSGPSVGGAAETKFSVGEALSIYQNYGYDAINSYLRGQGDGSEDVKDLVASMDKAFEQAKPLKYDMQVMRYDGAITTSEIIERKGLVRKLPQDGDLLNLWYDADAQKQLKEAFVGEIFTDKGFMSTTTSRESVKEFTEGKGANNFSYSPYGIPAVVNINVPKGTKVVDLGEDGFIAGSNENEVILNRGTSYKIDAINMSYDTACLAIYATVVTPTKKSQTFNEILKFNPYHDSKGRFANANSYTSFTYAPGKSRAHDLAIEREKARGNKIVGQEVTAGEIGKLAAGKHQIAEGKDITAGASDEDLKKMFQKTTKELMHEQGYDGVPKVVSMDEFKKAVGETGAISVRAVASESAEQAETRWAEFTSGEFYIAQGEKNLYGNGSYWATSSNANEPNHRFDANSAFLESHYFATNNTNDRYYFATLDKSAKIVDYGDLRMQRNAELQDVSTFKDFKFLDVDLGSYAVAKGYDAIYTGNDGGPYTNVLNRSKLIVSDKPVQYANKYIKNGKFDPDFMEDGIKDTVPKELQGYWGADGEALPGF